MLKAIIALAILAAVAHATVHVASSAAPDCTASITPTVTFSTSCSLISAGDTSCWTPHAPGVNDVVMFPGATVASIPFADLFTPFYVQSIIIAAGAKVTMNGGAMVVSECLQVQGTLTLDTATHVDNGTQATTPYPSDASVPMGTDCAAVPRGFSPRICGPGSVYVTGSLTLKGLYASLWAPTTVSSTATLAFNDESFLWGTLSNFGSLSANMRFFFHGSLINQANANARFTEIRPDFWTTEPGHENATLSIVNYGSMSFNLPKVTGSNYEYISTKDVNGTAFVTLTIENRNNLLFYSWMRNSGPNSYGGLALDLNNYGTTTWRGSQDFYGFGVATNYGTFIADQTFVGYQNYISHGGAEVTNNGGGFGFGTSEAASAHLRSRGIRGPYLSTVLLKNSRMSSPDHSGVFHIYAPIILDGDLHIAPGATLVNMIPYRVATLLLPGSNGKIVVGGKMMVGTNDELKPTSAKIVVQGTGSLMVPTGHLLVLHEASPLAIEEGGLLRVEGRVLTKKSSVAAASKLQFHIRGFGMGLANVHGDFSLDDMLVPIDF